MHGFLGRVTVQRCRSTVAPTRKPSTTTRSHHRRRLMCGHSCLREDESQIVIQSVVGDSLNDFGIYTSLYWSLTTDMGLPTDIVYSYTDVATISGCLSDGCYNFYLYDYGWTPGTGSANVTIDGTTTSYSLGSDEYSSVFALGVNTDACEVTIPGCTDPEALNYDPYATTDNGSCQYPFICDNGIHAFAYLFAGDGEMSIDIVGDNGDTVLTQNSSQTYGHQRGPVFGSGCATPRTSVVLLHNGNGFGSGQFGVGTYGLDLVFAEWPMDKHRGGGIQCRWHMWTRQFQMATAAPIQRRGTTTPLRCSTTARAYNDQCENMNEVTLLLDGGDWPGEVLLYLMTEDDEMLMALDGFTGSMTGCLADGCYKVEMHDSFGDGWNGAWAEMMVNGESVGTMSLSEAATSRPTLASTLSAQRRTTGQAPPLVQRQSRWSSTFGPTLDIIPEHSGARNQGRNPIGTRRFECPRATVASQALPVASTAKPRSSRPMAGPQGCTLRCLSNTAQLNVSGSS